jgi:hypothetical protein
MQKATTTATITQIDQTELKDGRFIGSGLPADGSKTVDGFDQQLRSRESVTSGQTLINSQSPFF